MGQSGQMELVGFCKEYNELFSLREQKLAISGKEKELLKGAARISVSYLPTLRGSEERQDGNEKLKRGVGKAREDRRGADGSKITLKVHLLEKKKRRRKVYSGKWQGQLKRFGVRPGEVDEGEQISEKSTTLPGASKIASSVEGKNLLIGEKKKREEAGHSCVSFEGV